MYNEMKKTISSWNRSWKGLNKNTRNRSLTGRKSRSISVTYFSLPVSFLIFFALLLRIVGA